MKRKLKISITKIRRLTSAEVAINKPAVFTAYDAERNATTDTETIPFFESENQVIESLTAGERFHVAGAEDIGFRVPANSIKQKGDL